MSHKKKLSTRIRLQQIFQKCESYEHDHICEILKLVKDVIKNITIISEYEKINITHFDMIAESPKEKQFDEASIDTKYTAKPIE